MPPATQHRILQKAKMTQAELARKVGVTSAQISFILAGRRNPPLTLAHAIARTLRISLDQLYRAIHQPAAKKPRKRLSHQ